MREAPVIIDDFRTEDGRDTYFVRPTTGIAGAGVIYLHWFDESPTANRTQFLKEAKQLARAGVVSVLPQLDFPWKSSPTDFSSDLSRIRSEIEGLRQSYATLAAVDGVDRIAMVGHDFGAMYAMLLLTEVEAAAAVLIAPTPRWADWFLRFWSISSDRFDYMKALNELDPITSAPEVACPLLFQFGDDDFYIAAMTATELVQAATEPKTLRTYPAGHEMNLDQIKDDRLLFLAEHLAFSF